MTDALLVVFENLISLLQNEFSNISGIKSKAEKLSTTLDLIKAVLEDAEKKQVTNRSIKVWLQQLKDVVYVLDDILDECSIKSGQLRGSTSFKPKNIMFRREIGNRLNEITRKLDDIADSKNKFILREGTTVKESSNEVAEWRQTSSIISEPKVFGREDDKENIVEFLLTQAKDSDFLSVRTENLSFYGTLRALFKHLKVAIYLSMALSQNFVENFIVLKLSWYVFC